MLLEMNRHADDETIEKYSMGTLPEAEVAGFEEHLLICPDCQDRLAENDNWVKSIRFACSELRNQSKPGWADRLSALFPLPSQFRWAAGFAVVAVVLITGRQWTSGNNQPVAVSLLSSRGPGVNAKAPARSPLILNFDLTELPALPSYRVEMADSSGNRVWESSATSQQDKISVSVGKRFSSGMYSVRLYAPSRELLREYGLQLE